MHLILVLAPLMFGDIPFHPGQVLAKIQFVNDQVARQFAAKLGWSACRVLTPTQAAELLAGKDDATRARFDEAMGSRHTRSADLLALTKSAAPKPAAPKPVVADPAGDLEQIVVTDLPPVDPGDTGHQDPLPTSLDALDLTMHQTSLLAGIGIVTAEALAAATPDTISKAQGISKGTAHKLIEKATALLAAQA